MNSLTKYLVEQVKGKTIAVFGGGFKPPTKGHFSVVKQALQENPSITEFRIYVGTGERDGISQSQSVLIWEIYAKYLPFKVNIIPSDKAPIRAIYNTAKDNPQDEVLWVIGAREGNEEDFSDIAKRTTSINKYPNLELRAIVSKDGISGTAARNALNQTPEKFTSFLPDELSDEEKQEIVSILSPSPINELLEQDDILSLEVVNPDGETFEIQENNTKGLYTYEDSMGNLYFARITFQPVDVPYFEFKVGWFEDNDIQKPKYEPQLPSNTTSRDDLKRRNTVAKIYRDKILPFFKENQNLSDKLIVIPMSNSRHIFSQRLLKNHTPNEFTIEENPTDLVVSLKQNINEEYILKNLEKEFPIELQLYDKGTHLELDKILVKYKKEGIGTKVMKKIIDYANKSEQPIYLTPSTSYGGSSVSRLEKFYKKLGFEPNRDKNISNLKMVKYPLNEGVESINYKQKIIELTKHMLDQGKNIKPLPKVVFKNDEAEANDFFGKTAYYEPSTQTIVLYVKDRHPKDIVRSYAHEMIHHIQNLEDRLGVISTTDTNEDDDLDKIEREAYLDGNMTFRNWTDTFVGDQMLKESLSKDPFGLTAYARELALLREDETNFKVYLDMDGVVADFERRFTELAGMAPKEFENKYGKNAFWDFIDEGDNKIKFWVGIPPMPGAKELVSHIVANFDYEMLTAPSLKKQSRIGKIAWIKKWTKEGLFPSKPKINFKAAKNKHKIKGKLTKFDILIDDKASTIDNWNEAGGTGILYLNAEQVIKELENAKKGI